MAFVGKASMTKVGLMWFSISQVCNTSRTLHECIFKRLGVSVPQGSVIFLELMIDVAKDQDILCLSHLCFESQITSKTSTSTCYCRVISPATEY